MFKHTLLHTRQLSPAYTPLQYEVLTPGNLPLGLLNYFEFLEMSTAAGLAVRYKWKCLSWIFLDRK